MRLGHPTDEQLRHIDIYFLATNIICSLSTLNILLHQIKSADRQHHLTCRCMGDAQGESL